MKKCMRCGKSLQTHAQLAKQAETAIAFGQKGDENVHVRIGWMLGALKALKSELLGVCWVCLHREELAADKARLADLEAAR